MNAVGLDTRCSDDGAVKRSRKPVQDLECRIKNHIRGMLSLKNILMMVCSIMNINFTCLYLYIIQIESRSHKGALEQLGASTVGANRSVDHDVNLITPLYLLSTVINDFGNEEVGSRISEVCDLWHNVLMIMKLNIIQLLLSAISNVLKIIQKDIKSRADVSFH